MDDRLDELMDGWLDGCPSVLADGPSEGCGLGFQFWSATVM